MPFRQQRAADLESFALLLEGVGFSNLHAIRDTVTLLRDKLYGLHTPGTTDYACWGYKINDLTIELNSLPRHVRPRTIHTISIVIDTDILAKCDQWETMNDPFIKMNFRVKIVGIDTRRKYFTGFHIDKHTGTNHPTEVHPLYHLQYAPSVAKGAGFGSLLTLDTPRIMHPPVELILGLDLVISNFLPETWNKLKNQPAYLALQKKYQNALWKPYLLTLASNWANHDPVTWNRFDLCPHFN